MPAGPAGSTTHSVDALILGSGSLGMWVLHRLNQDGVTSCVAIDPNSPGFGQTTHSHAFLHDGFVYRNSDGVLFRDSVRSWQQWLPTTSPASPSPSIDLRWSTFAEHVDAHPVQAPTSEYERWATTRAHRAVANRYSANNCARCVHPSGGAWPGVKTGEQSLDSSRMLDEFRRQYSTQVLRGDVLDIDVVDDQGRPRVDSVTVDPLRGDGTRITIQPRFVVCCAGSGNEQLLQRIRAPRSVVPNALQQVRNAGGIQHSERLEVICVRSAQGPNLPLHNGAIGRHHVANGNVGVTLNAQIVSRVDGNGRVVWVFNGSLSGLGAGKAFAGQDYRRIMVNEMCRLFGTSLGPVRQSAEWGTYLAPLTILTQGRVVDLFRSPRNDTYETLGLDGFAMAYVDRLTLAPVVAEELLNLMAPTLSQGGVATAATVPGLTPHAQSAVETWTTPQTWHTGGWLLWPDFQRDFL